MTTIIALATIALSGGQANNIESYLQSDLRDTTFVAKIVKGDQRELLKINKDFGQSYRFDSSRVYFKEPFKMRAEAHVEDTNVIYVINGTDLSIKIPNVKLPKQNLAKAPGRRQSLMDFGILTPSLMSGLLNAEFKRIDRETGDGVFDLTYKSDMDDASRYRVWIDRSKKYITKREWFNQWTRQLATFYYLNPVEVNGVWVPTRLEVKNVDNVIAGITKIEAIKVNTGISDSLFIAR
jgi:outer membrane lipoprotein-sorting protein